MSKMKPKKAVKEKKITDTVDISSVKSDEIIPKIQDVFGFGLDVVYHAAVEAGALPVAAPVDSSLVIPTPAKLNK